MHGELGGRIPVDNFGVMSWNLQKTHMQKQVLECTSSKVSAQTIES